MFRRPTAPMSMSFIPRWRPHLLLLHNLLLRWQHRGRITSLFHIPSDRTPSGLYVNDPRLVRYHWGSPVFILSRPIPLKRLRLKQRLPLSVRRLKHITDIRPRRVWLAGTLPVLI